MPRLSHVLFLLLAFLMGKDCPASEAGQQDYGLRTEPAVPLAGEPFYVVADGLQCLLFFNDTLFGPGYERVTLGPGLIQARIGYYSEATFGGMSCSTTGPHTVRVQVPGQPAGAYRLELLGRTLFGPDESEFIQAIGLVIAVSEPSSVPAGDFCSMGLLTLVVFGIGSGALRRMMG